MNIKGRQLQCKHCGSTDFAHRQAQLNTSFMEMFDLGWLNKSADVYVCSSCGFLHWFLDPLIDRVAEASVNGDAEPRMPVVQSSDDYVAPAEEPSPDDLSEPSECLSCGKMIPAGSAKCPSCGWSYQVGKDEDVGPPVKPPEQLGGNDESESQGE